MSKVTITIELENEQELSTTLQRLLGTGKSAVAVEPPAEAAAAPAKPKTTRKTAAKKDAPKEDITLETLRAAAYEQIQAGKRDEVTEALGKYGAKTLPEVGEADYAALMTDLGEL